MNPNDKSNKITLIEQLGCMTLLIISLALNIITPFIIIKTTNHIIGYEFIDLSKKNYFIIYLMTAGLMLFLAIIIVQSKLLINKIKSIWKKQKK